MRQLPVTTYGYQCGPIVYGCMGLGGEWNDSPVTADDLNKARAATEAAVNAGITLFDHADIYTRGKAEAVFGMLIKENPGLRSTIYVQSKCGIHLSDDPWKPHRYDFSYHHLISSVEKSLTRLQTDYLDFLLLHRPDPLMEPDEVARAFSQLHRQGKVRHFGVSNFTWPQLDWLQTVVDQPLIINQVELSLVHHHWLDLGVTANHRSAQGSSAFHGTMEYCQRNKIQIQSYGPLSKGLLTKENINPENESYRKVIEMIGDLSRKYTVSREAIVLAWLLRLPAGIQAVIGTTNPERIRACAQATLLDLSREEWYALYTAARGGRLP